MMDIGRFKSWLFGSLIFILIVVLVMVSLPRSDRHVELDKREEKTLLPLTKRELPVNATVTDHNSGVNRSALTPRIGGLLDLIAFEWDTGEVSPKLLSSLGVARSDRKAVDNAVKDCVGKFKVLEMENSKLVSGDGQHYVVLNKCEEKAHGLFKDVEKKLAEIVGDESAGAITSLLSSQLRNGGRDQVEIGFVSTSDGQFLLSERTLSRQGVETSLKENVFANHPDLGIYFRWEHLQPIYAGRNHRESVGDETTR